MYKYFCKACGKEFITDEWSRKFCDRRCYLKIHICIYEDKVCPVCGKIFRLPKVDKQKFCSKKCGFRYKSEKICKICKNKFEAVPQSNSKYCNNCRKRKCPICNKEFIIKPSARKVKKLCSKKCAGINLSINFTDKQRQIIIERNKRIHTGRKRPLSTRIKQSDATRGKKNHQYINGCTKRRNKLYDGIFYREWRNKVFQRDNYTCQKCGIRSGNGKKAVLEAHHIKRWSLYPDLRFDINNGITLCKNPCHLEETAKESKIYWKNQYQTHVER